LSARARTLYVGLDACALDRAQQFAAEGSMPTLARLLDEAAVQETLGPLGFNDTYGAHDPSPQPNIVHFPGIPLDDRLHELRRRAALV
jgi:hypothetical protein